jgi:hypothetical protein
MMTSAQAQGHQQAHQAMAMDPSWRRLHGNAYKTFLAFW